MNPDPPSSRPADGPGPTRVCVDADEAHHALDEGVTVVLIAPAAIDDLPPTGAGAGAGTRGRLALFIGDPADPAVVEAAHVMAAELFEL